jgi:hypothetical protein
MADTVTRPSIPRLTGRQIIFSASGNDPSHDSLKIPGGRTVGEVTTDEIRQIAARLGIENAHTAGRAEIVAAYAKVCSEIYDSAGLKALTEFLEERRRYE